MGEVAPIPRKRRRKEDIEKGHVPPPLIRVANPAFEAWVQAFAEEMCPGKNKRDTKGHGPAPCKDCLGYARNVAHLAYRNGTKMKVRP